MEEVVFGDGARIELGGEETGRGKILGAKKKGIILPLFIHLSLSL